MCEQRRVTTVRPQDGDRSSRQIVQWSPATGDGAGEEGVEPEAMVAG